VALAWPAWPLRAESGDPDRALRKAFGAPDEEGCGGCGGCAVGVLGVHPPLKEDEEEEVGTGGATALGGDWGRSG
jgi:hypothetical protein